MPAHLSVEFVLWYDEPIALACTDGQSAPLTLHSLTADRVAEEAVSESFRNFVEQPLGRSVKLTAWLRTSYAQAHAPCQTL